MYQVVQIVTSEDVPFEHVAWTLEDLNKAKEKAVGILEDTSMNAEALHTDSIVETVVSDKLIKFELKSEDGDLMEIVEIRKVKKVKSTTIPSESISFEKKMEIAEWVDTYDRWKTTKKTGLDWHDRVALASKEFNITVEQVREFCRLSNARWGSEDRLP